MPRPKKEDTTVDSVETVETPIAVPEEKWCTNPYVIQEPVKNKNEVIISGDYAKLKLLQENANIEFPKLSVVCTKFKLDQGATTAEVRFNVLNLEGLVKLLRSYKLEII